MRQPEELGELAEDAGSRPKGISKYLLDLDGKKLHTRNKTDIAQREEDLGFLFRAMDKSNMDYSVSSDLVLQVEVYRLMLSEQGDTRTDCTVASSIFFIKVPYHTPGSTVSILH